MSRTARSGLAKLPILWTALVLALGSASEMSAQTEREPRATSSPSSVEPRPPRQLYWGDLHVHTALSMDAYITNTRTMPDDAYRYAKGEAIDHVSGARIRIDRPLDFMAVTDHAEGLGVARGMAVAGSALSLLPVAAAITSEDYETSHTAFQQIVAIAANAVPMDFDATRWVAASAESADTPDSLTLATRDAWQVVIEAARAHYEPGKFTTFVGYEWSSMPGMANLHRNVIFRGPDAPAMPFPSTTSNRPEDLWSVLEEWRGRGSEVLAIPHNSNASMGRMFPRVDSYGEPVDAEYAQRRLRNEPLAEITQFKGTSETHSALAPLDEFAGFELWNTTVGAPQPVEPVPGSYVRNAYERGLLLEEEIGVNPYRFGLIGSSDTHNSSTAVSESAFTGGHGNADMTAEVRLDSRPSTLTASSLSFSASGLAGVWALENTREAIFDALRRSETFATSGPRIRARVFGAAALPGDLTIAEGTEVPMGGAFEVATGQRPLFHVEALRDPQGTALQRVQIVKGWVSGGEVREAIYDVACSDGLEPDPKSHRCPDNGAAVDLSDCSVSEDKGAAQLTASWQDSDYGHESAFYYVRVLENPSCRWSTWDSVRLGRSPPPGVASTLQERAWTSPIWVTAAPQEDR